MVFWLPTILTKELLSKRGWSGSNAYQFCGSFETIDYLFIQCPFVEKLWLSFGVCRDLIEKLPKQDILAAFCWSIWQERNSLCFGRTYSQKSIRNITSLIVALINHWTAHGHKSKRNVVEIFAQWSEHDSSTHWTVGKIDPSDNWWTDNLTTIPKLLLVLLEKYVSRMYCRVSVL